MKATTTRELIDYQFSLFIKLVKPRLTTGELQTLAAFVGFQKEGDTAYIPGVDENHHRVHSIGSECLMCGSKTGNEVTDDGLVRCENCGCH